MSDLKPSNAHGSRTIAGGGGLMRFARLAMIGLLAASPLHAQEIVYSRTASQACSEEATSDGERADCIGASARQCIEASGDGRIVRALCAIEETKYWGERLNAARGWLAESYAKGDAARRTDGSTPYPRSTAMQDMLQAWIGLRNARCRYEAAQWGGMPDSGLVEVECILRITGAQALYLETQPGDF